MRLLKKYWRLIIGLSLVCSGLSEIMSGGFWAGYGTFALGCLFVVWHAVSLLLRHHEKNKGKPSS